MKTTLIRPPHLFTFSMVLCGLLGFTPLTFGASKTWDAGGGANILWNTATNWDLDTLPAPADSVVFTSSGTGADLNGARTVNDLTMSGTKFTTSDSTLSATGLTITSGNAVFGASGTTTTLTVSNNITLGASGTWSRITGSTTTVNGNIGGGVALTLDGSAIFKFGGSNNVSSLTLNNGSQGGTTTFSNASAIGTGNLAFTGTGVNRTILLGTSVSGTAVFNNSLDFNLTSGNVIVQTTLSSSVVQVNSLIGTAAASAQTLRAEGKTFRILNGATGAFGGGLTLQNTAVAVGTFEIGGSTGANLLTFSGGAVAGAGSANLLFTSTVSQSGRVVIGTAANTAINTFGVTHASGTSTFSGNQTVTNSGPAGFVNYIAKDANSRMILSGTIDDGANTVGLNINHTYTDNVNGTNTPLGTVQLSGNNVYDGLTTVYAGILNIQNNSALGTTSNGTVVTSGAALEIQNNITVGAEALTVSGSGVSNGGALRNISGANTYGGVVTLAANSRINSDAGALTLTGGVANAGFDLSVGGSGTTTVSTAAISGTGSLTKDGSGKVILSSVNTYSGTTTVSAGTLVLSGSGSAGTGNLKLNGGTLDISTYTANAGTYALGSAQTVSGTGTILGSAGKSLSVAGAFGPGSSAGTITLDTVNLSLSGTSTFEFTNTNLALGTYDLVQGTAGGGTESATFGGTLALNFTGGSYGPFTLKIFDVDSYSGGFSSVTYSGLDVGQSATFNTLTGEVTVVPEPQTWALVGAGMASILFFRRRKTQS